MKLKQKLYFGSILALVLVGLAIFTPGKAHAATTQDPQDITRCLKTIGFENIATVECKFKAGDGSQQDLKFYDQDPTDDSNNTCLSKCAYARNYKPTSDFFCIGDDVKSSSPGFDGFYFSTGVTIQYPGKDANGARLTQDDARKAVNFVFNLGYADLKTNKCQYPKGYNVDNVPSTPQTAPTP